MKFEVVENGMGCCVLCRGPIFGKAIVVGNFDFICMACANGIAECVTPKETTEATAKEEFKCTSCGREFENRMALIAHKRYCKGGDSE
ncbi:hypothetical protein [Caldanaerobius polysaccharolyticus]|uniref:hypothetical protein n=1 Tax=Caldanaerobius polysaccharolyticus TaxID=44256 RepID=UPI000558329C|nr:hypothetical protein [Caldanaerobius polysaccharolyticus]